jgi:hypothetical protein
MDTVEYSALLTRFSKSLMRIAEGAEAAADKDIEGAERTAAIEAARSKLGEYNEIIATLSSDSKVLEGQFAKKFAASVDLIRESLERIDAE